jgi:hypothetical protein
MNRTLTRFLVLILAVFVPLGVISPASAAASPYCGITWGSLPKSAETPASNMILGIRAGQHACFDRLVVDLGGHDLTFRSYDVRYVPVVT